MKTLFSIILLLAVAMPVAAVEVSVTVTDLTANQQARLDAVLEAVNAKRVESGLAPFADYDAYARWVVIRATLDYESAQLESEALVTAEAVKNHGDEEAATGQCTAAGLAAGCRKAEVACFVLTGNVDCED